MLDVLLPFSKGSGWPRSWSWFWQPPWSGVCHIQPMSAQFGNQLANERREQVTPTGAGRVRRAAVTGNYRYSVGIWPSERELVTTFTLSYIKWTVTFRQWQVLTCDAVTMELFIRENKILLTKLWPEKNNNISQERSRKRKLCWATVNKISSKIHSETSCLPHHCSHLCYYSHS